MVYTAVLVVLNLLTVTSEGSRHQTHCLLILPPINHNKALRAGFYTHIVGWHAIRVFNLLNVFCRSADFLRDGNFNFSCRIFQIGSIDIIISSPRFINGNKPNVPILFRIDCGGRILETNNAHTLLFIIRECSIHQIGIIISDINS